MQKIEIKDFYFAGLIIGMIGGIIQISVLLLLILLGVKTRTSWNDLAEVFFNPPQVHTWQAQLFGVFASLGMTGLSGILIALLIKLTGKDYIYVKSISGSVGMGFFMFIVVYPALGLKFLQHSITTNYVAPFTFIIYGATIGYLFKRFTDFDN